jgi:hypothetical protein
MMNVTLIPVRIAAGVSPIDAVHFPDGRIGATLRSLCRILSIDSRSQLARVKRHPKLSEALTSASIQFGSSSIRMDILLHWAIPIWATGLSISRLPVAKQPLALLLQSDAVDLIEQAFAQPENDTASQPPLTQSPVPQSVWQEGHAFIDHLQDYFQSEQEGLRREVYEQQQETRNQLIVLQYDLHNYELRFAALEANDVDSSLDLSPEHLKYIFRLARQLSERRGLAVVDILALLAEHFRVGDVSLLLEKDWPAVLDWFSSLLEEW